MQPRRASQFTSFLVLWGSGTCYPHCRALLKNALIPEYLHSRDIFDHSE